LLPPLRQTIEDHYFQRDRTRDLSTKTYSINRSPAISSRNINLGATKTTRLGFSSSLKTFYTESKSVERNIKAPWKKTAYNFNANVASSSSTDHTDSPLFGSSRTLSNTPISSATRREIFRHQTLVHNVIYGSKLKMVPPEKETKRSTIQKATTTPDSKVNMIKITTRKSSNIRIKAPKKSQFFSTSSMKGVELDNRYFIHLLDKMDKGEEQVTLNKEKHIEQSIAEANKKKFSRPSNHNIRINLLHAEEPKIQLPLPRQSDNFTHALRALEKSSHSKIGSAKVGSFTSSSKSGSERSCSMDDSGESSSSLFYTERVAEGSEVVDEWLKGNKNTLGHYQVHNQLGGPSFLKKRFKSFTIKKFDDGNVFKEFQLMSNIGSSRRSVV